MSYLRQDLRQRAEEVISLYPRKRSAMLPLLHIAQEQEGHLTEDAITEVAELTGTTPADVRGTAAFYDMFQLESVGRYVVGVCTNIACLLAGGLEMLEHARATLGCAVGETSEDGLFTLEESECLADCDVAPCVQVNYRFVRTTTTDAFDTLVGELRAGTRDHDIPEHGTLVRVRRNGGLHVPRAEIVEQRASAKAARAKREEESKQ